MRDVPPPRPVSAGPSGEGPVEETGPLARAARAVADAVSGLLGSGPAEGAGPENGRPPAAAVADVAKALVGAVASWRLRRGPSDGDGGGPATEAESEGWSPGAFLGDLLSAAVPRLQIRDRSRLRAAHPDATDEEIADALVARASRLTAGVGAATGGLSAVQWLTAPSLVALPVELGVETLLVAAVEVVLIGELHELYGRSAPGDTRARAAAYLSSWSAQRAIDGAAAPGLLSVLSGAGLHALRRRLTRRVARGLPSMAPFFIGAALGSRGNRKATEGLARRVVADLRAGRHPRP